MYVSPLFCCNQHGEQLKCLTDDGIVVQEVPISGTAVCASGCRFPIAGGVPRFVPDEDYSGNFGFEWNQYPRLQLDSNTGTPISASRLERCLGQPLASLACLDVLEAGCGSGRFSEVILAAGARLCSLDLSSAVDANHTNHVSHPRFFVVQANLHQAPYRKRSFDVVICLGVLQHTPDPASSLATLASYAKPGGLVVVDSYIWTLRRVLAIRYLYRAWLKRLEPRRAHEICRRMVDRWLPLHKLVGRSRVLSRLLHNVSPITTYYHCYDLSDDLHCAFSYLDTFDFHSPRYEWLKTPAQIRRGMETVGLSDIAVSRGGNGIEARGRVPLGVGDGNELDASRLSLVSN